MSARSMFGKREAGHARRSPSSSRRARWTCLVALAAVVSAPPVTAQSVRITGTTTVRYIELRPFIHDSVAAEDTEGEALLRQLPDGRIVRCVPGDSFCRDVRPGAMASTLPAIHDVEASAWGFGRGVRLFTHVRGRNAFGGNRALWPRGDDAVEVVDLYGEVERERWRLRAGRQWKVSGLGVYNFDGLAAAVRPFPSIWLEVYTGRSLIRGLNETRAGAALESIEPLAPPKPGLLVGLHARYRPAPRLALSALYQIDVRDDRNGIYSELAMLDGTLRVRGASIESSLELDVAGGAVNQARVQVRSPPFGRFIAFAEARHYQPYFELWTIWGAFSPVGFDEGRGGVTWARPDGRLILRGEASYRDYGNAGREETLDEFRSDGWGIGASASWSPERAWRLDGSYRVQSGFGAARWDGQVGVRRELANGAAVSLQALSFQRLYEFRLNESTVVGFGGDAMLPLSERLQAFVAAMVYRHAGGGSSAGIDWNQRRATVRLQWAVGSEPRSVARGGRGS